MSYRFTLYVAVYLILKKDTQILMLRRANTGFLDGQFTLPSGHLEGKETVTEAMIREAQEEAGVKIKKENLKIAHVMNRYSNDREYIDFFIIADKWEGDPVNAEPHKHDELGFHDIDNLPENTIEYVEHAIKCSFEGMPYCEYRF